MSKIIQCELGEIGKVCMCKRVLKNQTSLDENIPFYKISTFGGEPDTFISEKLFKEYKEKYSYPQKGDILISAAGTLGKTVVYDGSDSYYQDSNIVWIDNDESKVLNSYLKYFYKIIQWKKTTGSTIDRLYNENISGAMLFYPEDLSEQQKIASTLQSIDNKIELNNKINTELESMAKTLYDYWFLQFEFPNEEGKPYKSSGGKMVWNEELKREIPEGWEVNNIAKSILKSKNGDWGTEELVNEDDIKVNCFRGADFASITKEYDMTAPIRYIKKKNHDRLLSDGDLITEISGGSPTQSTGRIGYINQFFLDRSENVMDCSNFCKAFTPKKKNYQFWLYQTWKTLYENGTMFNYESKTTGLKNLMFDEFINNVLVIYPKENILEKFQNISSIIYNKIQKNLMENQELASLRDFLLPLLMNGQVGFKE